MTVETLLQRLEAKGIQFGVDEGELVINAPKGAMTRDLLDELKRHKADLLETLLRHDTNAPGPTPSSPRSRPFCITPEMLTLVELGQTSIDSIVAQVPGGAANVQDIYPLLPLQEGILFHHLMNPSGDAYLVPSVIGFARRERMDTFLNAIQQVIDRHDILRTAIVWEGIEQPVQAVMRKAVLSVETLSLLPDDGDVQGQLETRFDPAHYRMDLRTAPLIKCHVAQDVANDRWLMHILAHHLVIDHTTLALLVEEAGMIEQGLVDQLPPPVPFRNFVAQARLGASQEEQVRFFSDMLGDIDEPTAPFGLRDVQGDGSNVVEAHRVLDDALGARIRERVRALGVSAASLMHLAWAMVVSRTTGRGDVVFGTVLFGRMQGGNHADRVLGMFINTLPLRLRIGGEGVESALRSTHEALAQLLRHEHAPLSLAQRCSGVDAPAPLFTSLLNYRYSGMRPGAGASDATAAVGSDDDIQVLGGHERTNYPLTISIDDYGDEFSISAQAISPLDADRICDYLVCAIERVTDALAHSPRSPVGRIDILPAPERHQVLVSWNATDRPYPRDMGVHTLFEAQALAQPEAVAVIGEAQQLS
ncbi:condensation domain-containing protein, partial [Denitromonas iodatirespirans]